ncbi:MAG TPA: DUF3108 domain-containing protein [Steroidobacteraceae bacterium]|nr:DUF3108 domain-containing protein [Steroidobacteraceae bacterium]
MRATDARIPQRLLAGLSAFLLGLGAGAPAQADGLRPHDVVYQFLFKGISGGTLELKLLADSQPGSWIYETHAHPNFLASFFVSPNSIERGWFRVTPAGVEPQRYLLDEGSSDKGNGSDLKYDWTRGRLTGEARGKPLDLAIEPGTQDVMSIRAVVLVDLLAGREPHEYTMLDGRELKHYVYTRIGTAKLKTDIGEYDTVIYKSDRKDSDGRGRTWQYWYAPALGWLPLRAEQREDGKARMTLAIRSLKWLDGGAPAAAPRS